MVLQGTSPSEPLLRRSVRAPSLLMAEENVLQAELSKLDVAGLKRVAQVWNIPNIGKDKKTIVKNLLKGMNNDFFLKGILEKLSAVQVTIYSSIIKSKGTILTLGEIARKISMPPVNAEMELGVLKRYFLVFQRKNRERLTNNLDKYHYYPESGDLVRLETNEKGQKLRQGLAAALESRDELPDYWSDALGLKKTQGPKDVANWELCTTPEALSGLLGSLGAAEKSLVSECFMQGGVLEFARAKDLLIARKGKWEDTIRKIHDLGVLLDVYYIDEKFVRVLVLPPELFAHLQQSPILPPQKRGTKKRQDRATQNDLDFFLDLKKMIVYISRKGLNLAKSGKIKQADLRDTENRLLKPDISLFIEKSEIYQIELLLPIMRLLDIVRVKRDDVVLRNQFDELLLMDPFKLMEKVMKVMDDARERRVRYEDVFEPMYVPFYQKAIFTDCINYVARHGGVPFFVVIASLVREKLVLAKSFRIKNFQAELAELRRETTSALFYQQLLGLLAVEYPDRTVRVSELGQHYLKGSPLTRKDEPGGVIINPDLSLIAIPENLSLRGLSLLKTFCELKSYDNIYQFQLTRESFQEGLLLKQKREALIDLLKKTSKNELSQNLLFSVEDWSRALPLVTITDECVVLQTSEPNHMELLLGQINGKKIVIEKVSPTTVLIDAEKIQETIGIAEKLNLIVRLIR